MPAILATPDRTISDACCGDAHGRRDLVALGVQIHRGVLVALHGTAAQTSDGVASSLPAARVGRWIDRDAAGSGPHRRLRTRTRTPLIRSVSLRGVTTGRAPSTVSRMVPAAVTTSR